MMAVKTRAVYVYWIVGRLAVHASTDTTELEKIAEDVASAMEVDTAG